MTRDRLLQFVALLSSGAGAGSPAIGVDAAPVGTKPPEVPRSFAESERRRHVTSDDNTETAKAAREQIDRVAVFDVIMRERLARETHNLADEAACFHPDAVVEVSWFKGSAAKFVESAKNNRDTATVQFDSMSPGVVWLKNDRAIADTACAVHTFSRLDEIEVSTTSYTRLLWRVQRFKGHWLILGLRGIYIRDTLIPRDPNKVPRLDEQRLSRFRSSYRYLSYLLTAAGSPAHNDLPGVDRPETVTAIRAAERKWLEEG